MLSYTILIIGNAISVFYTPIMLRLLGQSEYGLMSMATSVTGYLGLLSFGLSASFIRYNARYKVAGDKEGESNLNGMYMTVYSIIGVLSLICGIILVIYSDSILGSKFTVEELKKAKILMSILTFNIAISFPSSVFGMYNNAYEKFVFGRVLALISTILNPLMTLPVLLMGYGSIGMILVQTVLSVLNTAAMVIYSKKVLKMKITFRKFDIPIIKEIFIFSSFIFMNMIADQINLNANKLIVGKIIGTIGVAVYTIGSQMNTYYISIASAISNVFIPRVNAMVISEKDDSEVFKLFTRIGRILFILVSLFLSGFILVGKVFIQKWAGADYSKSYYIALILLIAVTLPLIQIIGVEIQKAKNMHKFRSVVMIGVAIGNIALSIPLCIRFGEIGSAVGTAIAYVTGNLVIMNFYYKKKMGFDMFKFWKDIFKLLPAVVISGIIGFAVKYFLAIDGLILVALFSLGYTLLFTIILWFMGMNSYEKKLISGPVSAFYRRIKKLRNRTIKAG
jgi:O-antigen/teichoic acid export membrane protein